MEQHPLISVLMTSYNAEAFIAEAIESVVKQTYQNWELLILDDASKDGTRAVIDSFHDERIRRIYNAQNIGYVASKNILLENISGEFACFVDADDWVDCTLLDELLKAAISQNAMACVCDYARISPDGKKQVLDFYEESRFIDVKKDEIVFPGGGILFKTEVVKRIGGFEMFFDKLLGDDNYWAFKIAEKYPFYYFKKPLYNYRANPNSLTAVFNNLRKLTVVAVLNELKKQRLKTGTDWLEQDRHDRIEKFEKHLLSSKKWLSEQYRMYAAVRLDYKDHSAARRLIWKAFKVYPLSTKTLRTYFYLIRQKLS